MAEDKKLNPEELENVAGGFDAYDFFNKKIKCESCGVELSVIMAGGQIKHVCTNPACKNYVPSGPNSDKPEYYQS